MPVAHPAAADVGAGVVELPVAAADTADRPAGIESGKVTSHSGAAVDGAHSDLAAGDADTVRGVGISTGHGGLLRRAAPPSPQIAAGWGYGMSGRPPAEKNACIGRDRTRTW